MFVEKQIIQIFEHEKLSLKKNYKIIILIFFNMKYSYLTIICKIFIKTNNDNK